VRLDAAPSSVYRNRLARPVGGVVAPATDPNALDPASEDPRAAEPPPSIDGKGTLINTYA
jgi:hypothetical protein